MPVYSRPNVTLHANPASPTKATSLAPTPSSNLLRSVSPAKRAIEHALDEWVEGKPYSRACEPTERRTTGGEKGRGTEKASLRTDVA